MKPNEAVCMIKKIGMEYSCKFDGTWTFNQLKHDIKIIAKKGRTKEIYSASFTWLNSIDKPNLVENILSDIARWFNFYFIKKKDWDVLINGKPFYIQKNIIHNRDAQFDLNDLIVYP
jgi:hypothetical protein